MSVFLDDWFNEANIGDKTQVVEAGDHNEIGHIRKTVKNVKYD